MRLDIRSRPLQRTKKQILRATVSALTRKRRIHGHKRLISLTLRGLDRMRIRYRYDSLFFPDSSTSVLTFYNSPVRDLLTLRRTGRIKRLILGPCTLSSDSPFTQYVEQHADAIDAVLVHSQWSKYRLTEVAPGLSHLIHTWPIGVDLHEWSPPRASRPRQERREVLVYQKNGPDPLLEEIAVTLSSAGFTPVILRYGSYTLKEYYTRLSASSFAIFLTKCETQGMAMTEAWAMDVPTLVWTNGRTLFDLHQHTCPLLTRSTGRPFDSANDLRTLLQDNDWSHSCQPRKWIRHHLTLEASIANLVAACQSD
uniref:Glycosyl transferase group 1 n=1 Tax=Rubinisphaera brasiliensis (strain ATCC 49424 / DSM 5305 / JCM 21570 / IAM 15109 / NBRC 103401 / IFAM 1448) TaxID=756272 RepID=F0SI53_RUBBR|nr:hypothetical protein Plabr_4181 [Rubinisphaera brasiliensis DSM 5305]